MPVVSVILCGYNQAEFIDHAIQSVLNQTYSAVELVIVDNGSTDDSQEIIRRYAEDDRVLALLHSDNAAITRRLNEGIAASSGDFISLLYADDYYLPEKLERQMAVFADLPPDYGVVYGPGYRLGVESGAKWVDRSLTRSGDVFDLMLELHWSEGFINPIAPLMKRACFEEYPFQEDFFVEGESIFLRFALSFKFKYMEEPLVVMREHGGNMGKAIKRNTEIALDLLSRVPDEARFREDSREALTTFRSELMRNSGWLGVRMASDARWSRSLYLRSIRLRPRQLFRLRTIVGLLFSLLPNGAVRFFNRTVNKLKARQETVAFRSDYS